MPINNHALIILWSGKDIPDFLVAEIAEILSKNRIAVPELMHIIYKDQAGIADSIIRDCNGESLSVNIKSELEEEQEAIKNAIVYIGERFATDLANKNGGLLTFAVHLTEQVSKARVNTSMNTLVVDENDKALLNAVEIIATKRNDIPMNAARLKNISPKAINVISQVYYQFT